MEHWMRTTTRAISLVRASH